MRYTIQNIDTKLEEWNGVQSVWGITAYKEENLYYNLYLHNYESNKSYELSVSRFLTPAHSPVSGLYYDVVVTLQSSMDLQTKNTINPNIVKTYDSYYLQSVGMFTKMLIDMVC
jgi:hypothetical protein